MVDVGRSSHDEADPSRGDVDGRVGDDTGVDDDAAEFDPVRTMV